VPPEQPGIGRLTSTPQGVDMADGGSKPPQPMAPDTADDGMKPSRLGAPPHPLRPGGHLPQIPRSSAEFGGGGISLRDAYPSPFTLRVLRGYDVAIGEEGRGSDRRELRVTVTVVRSSRFLDGEEGGNAAQAAGHSEGLFYAARVISLSGQGGYKLVGIESRQF